ncbi:MAG: IclR family transcriptional regulator [Microbacteriaceae bacterium]
MGNIAIEIDPGPVSTLEKAMLCLRIIGSSSHGAMTATEITAGAAVPKATAHRVLKSLVEQKLLTFDANDKRYRLGPTILNLGLTALSQLDIPKIARPYLQKLARETLETTTLSMLQGDSRVYLDQIPSTQEIKMTVPLGMSFPLYAGASSKAILSAFTEQQLAEYLEQVTMSPLTSSTPLDPQSLMHEIEEIHALGYAVSRGERQADAASIAAPIMGSDGKVFGAISVSGPIQRFDRYGNRSIGRMVRESAVALSTEIGFTGRFPNSFQS